MSCRTFFFGMALAGSLIGSGFTNVRAQEAAESQSLQLIAEDDFEENRGQWEMLDPESWQFAVVDGRGVLSQFVKKASYKPPHRSPYHIALLKDHAVGDFDLSVSVRSTEPEYGHRDACIFFGFVDPAHFYYVHLGRKTDPHANQIFIVNGADRKAISLTTTDGTVWTDEWHRVKVTRRTDSGRIEVFFDDFDEPAMTAEDKTFVAGRVGLGSFDDRADWDDFELHGVPAKPNDGSGQAPSAE